METIYLIIENPRALDLGFRAIRVEDYTVDEFINTAEFYYKAGFMVSFKRFNY